MRKDNGQSWPLADHVEAHAVNYFSLLGTVNEQVIQPVNKTSGCPARGTLSVDKISIDTSLTKATPSPNLKLLLERLGTLPLQKNGWKMLNRVKFAIFPS